MFSEGDKFIVMANRSGHYYQIGDCIIFRFFAPDTDEELAYFIRETDGLEQYVLVSDIDWYGITNDGDYDEFYYDEYEEAYYDKFDNDFEDEFKNYLENRDSDTNEDEFYGDDFDAFWVIAKDTNKYTYNFEYEMSIKYELLEETKLLFEEIQAFYKNDLINSLLDSGNVHKLKEYLEKGVI